VSPDPVAPVLADFRDWLTAFTEGPPEPAAEAESTGEPVDLHTLLGHFVALRQEVNLQTRAVRSQQEQSGETLRQLQLALEALRLSQAQGQTAQQSALEERLRPLLKTLVDLYDSLALAGREIQRVQANVLPLLDEAVSAPEEPAPPPPPPAGPPKARSFWARWLGSAASAPSPLPSPSAAPPPESRGEERAAEEARREQGRRAREGWERVRQALESLVTGYAMSLQRVEKALRQYGLEPIATVGFPFDPERMEALEIVTGSGRPSNEVVEEVRRGYLWNGRVFRYAQVRVAKG
jgi:molecular chaperone GrpE